MKKEVILAIVIGFGLGLVITFGIYTARTALNRTTQASPLPSPPPSPQTENPSNITISSPQNESVVSAETITIQGKTDPQSVVALMTASSSVITVADAQGGFDAEVELEAGLNQVQITAFSPQNQKSETILSLAFSTSKPSSKNAWPGNITDITNHTLSLKTDSLARQVEASTSAEILDKDRKKIKFSDLALNTFILALGELKSDTLLNANRILVIAKPNPLPYQTYLTTVTAIGDKNIPTVQNLLDTTQTWQLALTDSTNFTQELEAEDLQANDKLVLIARPDPKSPNILDVSVLHLATLRPIPAAKSATPSSEKE